MSTRVASSRPATRTVSESVSPASPGRPRQPRRWFLAPLTVLLVVMGVVPVLYGLYESMTDRSGAFVGLVNYRDLLGDDTYRQAVGLTVLLMVASVAITMVIGTWLAFTMYGIDRGQHLLRALLILPLASAPIAVMYSWKTMLNSSYGVVNYLLDKVGVAPVAWYGEATPALISILVIDVWMWTSFVMIIVYGGLMSVPPEVREAAAVDGAGPVMRFRYVILPAIYPYVLVAVLFRAVDSLKIFDSVAVLTAGGPGNATTTMNWFAYREQILFLNFGKGSAAAILLLLLGVAFTSLIVRYLRQSTDVEVAR
jgi:multiple sugar transport system permease protein